MPRRITLLSVLSLSWLLPLAGCVFPQREEVVYIEPDWTYTQAATQDDAPADDGTVVTAPTRDE